MAKAKRSLRANTRAADGGEQVLAALEVEPRSLAGVSRIRGGRLKMVGAPHDARLGMTLPSALVDAWNREAEEAGITKTDLFEDVMLKHLKRQGWKLEA